MKKITWIFLLAASLNLMAAQKLDTRFIGLITDFKILSVNEKEIVCWVKCGYQEYFIGCADVPDVYVGDSLLTFWLNYQKYGVGKPNGKLHRIIK